MNCANFLLKSIFMVAVVAIFASGKHWPHRPFFTQKAEMARFMMRNAEWCVVSMYSTNFKVPFGYVQSFVDGPVGGSTGIPYFYIAKISDIYRDIKHNNTATLFVGEAMSDFCEKENLDPEEPLCGRTMTTGNFVPVEDQEEVDFAKNALLSRHPAMRGWAPDHGWTVYKLNITSVYMLDFYGGGAKISPEDYFNAE